MNVCMVDRKTLTIRLLGLDLLAATGLDFQMGDSSKGWEATHSGSLDGEGRGFEVK